MAYNIYYISNWSTGQNWYKNDIVKYNGLFYYALNDITNSTVIPSTDTTNFGGMFLDEDGNYRPKFLWSCSYGFNYNREPNIQRNRMGDGYEQRMAGNINTNLLDLDISFSDRTEKEIYAIEHFLTVRNGVESFLFTPPGVFTKEKLFICSNWSNSNKFHNNYEIRAKFSEVPA